MAISNNQTSRALSGSNAIIKEHIDSDPIENVRDIHINRILREECRSRFQSRKYLQIRDEIFLESRETQLLQDHAMLFGIAHSRVRL